MGLKLLEKANLENKTVFLRVDWNVPLKEGKIADDNRIEATIPTIKYLRSKDCKIIIGTHLGRPDGEIVPELSTKILSQRLSKLISAKVYATDFVVEPAVKKEIKNLKTGEILVLGNLRWHSEEEANNFSFGKILASYADIFVNDAFAVSHRAHASVEAITKYLPSYAGFLLEKEVESLKILTESPRQPFVLVLGGAKIKDKIKLIKKFAPNVDKIIIGGAIANTIRKFKGTDISVSYHEPNVESIVEDILSVVGDKLILPTDDKRKQERDGKFSILDIGPKTIENYKKIISEAKTIFWNGNMGYSEDKDFESGTLEIAKAIKDNKFIRIVAGGDTVGFLGLLGLTKDYSFVSTGGGAALEFLAGIELPGLKALDYYK